jgi:NAD(P)-dependent dehydrogenase (short-subunit alcohol dehydrogenase family)
VSDVEERVAIVTAASRGIGAVCVRELKLRGYRLVIMSRSEAIERLAKETGACAVRGSICEPDDLQRLVTAALDRHGRIDALVNSSGNPAGGELLAIPDEQWQKVFNDYLLAVVRMARLVVPVMARQGRGAIVSISGSDALEPDARFPVASVMRASLASYTKLLAREVAGAGIRVNCVAPSVVFDHDPKKVRPDIRAEVPLGRPARYEEVAKVVAFLLSDEASYLTGEHLRVDGGASRSV